MKLTFWSRSDNTFILLFILHCCGQIPLCVCFFWWSLLQHVSMSPGAWKSVSLLIRDVWHYAFNNKLLTCEQSQICLFMLGEAEATLNDLNVNLVCKNARSVSFTNIFRNMRKINECIFVAAQSQQTAVVPCALKWDKTTHLIEGSGK